MQMNPGIILSGQQPNLVNTLARSTRAAQMANQNRDQNALRQVFQTQGPQIMAGEGNALNALARIDPNAALGVQGARQDMAAQRQRMGILNAQEQRAVESWAMQQSAAERARAAQEVEQGLMMAVQAYRSGDLAGINGILQRAGEAPIASLDEFPGLAARYSGALDVLVKLKDFDAGPKPQSGPGKVQADKNAGLLPPDTPLRGNANGFSVTTPDGMTITQGGAVNIGPAPKMTVDAAKNSGFLIRTIEANKVLNELEGQGTEFVQQNLEHVPFGAGNYFRSPEFQRFDQARRDFVNAILRRESGAVISDQEFDNADKQYFPMPGDSPEVIAQKRRNRETAIQGLRVGSGPGAGYVDQLRQAEEQPAGEPSSAAPPQIPEVPNFTEMSDEELDAYIKELGGGE